MIVGRKPKLTPEQVRELRAWARIGRTQTEARRYFGLGATAFRKYMDGTHKRVYG